MASNTKVGQPLRFVKRAISRDTNKCIEWKFSTVPKGYGTLRYNGKNIHAHRLAFELYNGVDLESAELVMHQCNNRLCINPRHLEAGTAKENSEYMVISGNSTRGEKSTSSVLTEKQVLAIYRDNRMHKYISKQYGIACSTVSSIKSGRNWYWLTSALTPEGDSNAKRVRTCN